MPAIPRDIALTIDEVHGPHRNGKGRCQVWRRNGRTQTWKRDPTRYRMPVKYGLYGYGALTEDNTDCHLPEDCPYATSEQRQAAKEARLAYDTYLTARAGFDDLRERGVIMWNHTANAWWYPETGDVYTLPF